jgi:hypothetical protein
MCTIFLYLVCSFMLNCVYLTVGLPQHAFSSPRTHGHCCLVLCVPQRYYSYFSMVKPKIGCAHCLPFLAGRRVLLSYATAKSLPLPSTDLLSRDRRLPSYRDGRVCIQTPLFTYPRRGGQRAWIQVGNLHRTCEIRVSSAAPCSLHFDAMTRAGSL